MVAVMSMGAFFDWNLYYCLLSGLFYPFVYLVQIPWAVVSARNAPQDYVPRWYNRVLVYIGFWLGMVLLSVFAAVLTRVGAVEAFKVPAGSLRPNVLPGDHVFVAKIGQAARTVSYGDLVVFRHPNGREDYIKRVAAKPGDTVEVRSGALLINGKALLREPCETPVVEFVEYNGATGQGDKVTLNCQVEHALSGKVYNVLSAIDSSAKTPDFGPQLVPEGHLFMLGDSRDLSYDSRMWGSVPFDNIIGKPTVVWWSSDPKDGMRVERLGLRL